MDGRGGDVDDPGFLGVIGELVLEIDGPRFLGVIVELVLEGTVDEFQRFFSDSSGLFNGAFVAGRLGADLAALEVFEGLVEEEGAGEGGEVGERVEAVGERVVGEDVGELDTVSDSISLLISWTFSAMTSSSSLVTLRSSRCLAFRWPCASLRLSKLLWCTKLATVAPTGLGLAVLRGASKPA